MSLSLREMAVEVLCTADAYAKVALSRAHAARWQAARAAGEEIALGQATPPDAPARPARPQLLSPRDVPHRKPGTPEGRIAMLHAIAHIELNAVDLRACRDVAGGKRHRARHYGPTGRGANGAGGARA